MLKQIFFIASLLVCLGVFSYSVWRLYNFFRLTQPAYPIRNIGKRIWLTLEIAFWQTKIFRRPVIGFIHAIVFWGFCVILVGSAEVIIDGIFGTERFLKVLGVGYDVITSLGDIFAFLIAISILIFLFRRVFMKVKRFYGAEMKKKYKADANFALTLIFLLMISLLGMNAAYSVLYADETIYGVYPASILFTGMFSTMSHDSLYITHEIFWWTHILLIFFFANYLPYSKHFHVFMSVPNVFFSRLEVLGKLPNMDNVTNEVKMMLNPNTVYNNDATDAPKRFGIRDIEDVTWKNYVDSLSCTQCGRCTSVCPANITGKKLSPRKLFIDLRNRMNNKAPHLIKNKEYTDNKSLIRDYITAEELWACATCNACAKECPININHPTLIIDMRRYLVMEEAAAPSELNAIFANIENNGAPWQFSPNDRLLWTEK